MAEPTTCPQGHRYELAENERCPICAAHSAAAVNTPTLPPRTEDLLPPEIQTLPPTEMGAMSEPAWPAVPGYEILAELGRGGMGVVYKARQITLNRPVALKMILAGEFADAAARQRFLAEAEAIARLQHPHIVQVYEFSTFGQKPYFALEYVAGGSLAQKLAGTPQQPRDAAELVEKLARAIQAAHDKGIVHRDLKPANVLLVPPLPSGGEGLGVRGFGEPKLTDFGLAKRIEASPGRKAGEDLTRTGAILGTPSYMAPEQAEGKKAVGPAADTYALGAILYECLTGRPPFKAATPLDTVLQVVSEEPLAPSQLNAKIPRDLETICLKCLRKEPEKRYASAALLADDLRAFLDGRPITARPVGRIERGWRWCRRNPVGATLLLTLILGTGLATGLALWALGERSRADDEAATAKKNEELAKANEEVAKQNAATAKSNEDLANKRADDALAAVEQFQVASGLREMESGQLFQALRWFALPLNGEGAKTARAEMHRDRLSNYWRLPQARSATRYVLAQSLQHQGVVTWAAFSPDGRRLVTASSDKTARVWDAATGQPAGPPSSINTL